MKKISRLLVSVCFLFCSCEKMVLGEEEENDPINNFEILWNDFDQHCGIIFPQKLNWDSLYRVYRPMVTEQTTQEELWDIFTQLLDNFDDEHTSLEDPANNKVYVSGSEGIAYAQESFSIDLIGSKYLESISDTRNAPELKFGKVKDKKIGYIWLGDVDGNSGEEAIAEILAGIGDQDAIIFDVRDNGGGDDRFALGMTDAFADENERIMSVQTRNGPNHDDFDEIVWKSKTNDGTDQYLKPVIIITHRYTVSAAEYVTIHLRANDQVTHIGETTAGAFSSVGNQRFLPNGWLYKYPVQMILDPEGKPLVGKGLVPEIEVINTPEDIVANTDKVLETAIQYLFDTYGIE